MRELYTLISVMKKMILTKKVMIALLGAVLLAGCSKSESGTEQEQVTTVTATTARSAEQQSIENTIANFYDCLKKLKPTGFSDFFYDNFFVPSELTENKTWYTYLSEKFQTQYTPNGFIFDNAKGTYSWNSTQKVWVKTAENTNVTLHFPKNNVATSNNATVVIEDYASVIIGKINLPTKGKFTATVDGSKVMEVDIQGINYGLIPTLISDASIVIYGNPFTTTVSLKKNGNAYAFSSNTSAPDGCTTTIDGVINLTNNSVISTENVNFKDIAFTNFKNLTFNVNFEELTIKVNANIEGLKNLNKEEYSIEDMNTFVKVEVLSSNKKVADLIYNEDSNGKYDPDVVLLDGTSQKAADYFSYFSRKVKHVFRTIFGLE